MTAWQTEAKIEDKGATRDDVQEEGEIINSRVGFAWTQPFLCTRLHVGLHRYGLYWTVLSVIMFVYFMLEIRACLDQRGERIKRNREIKGECD